MSAPDNRLDTIASCIGFGVQVQSSRSPLPAYVEGQGTHYPANGLRVAIFAAASTDDGQHTPAQSAELYLTPDSTDELIQVLQAHRARMIKPPAPVLSRLEVLVARVNALLPEVESEIEQRKHGGNDEDWQPLQALVDNVKDALP